VKRRLKIQVLVDAATIPDEDPEFRDAAGEATTERHVVNALRRLGHDVSIVRAGSSVPDLVASLQADRGDLVFNLTEVFRDSRRLDKNIAALLEMLGMPFTGTGAAGLMLCRDKGLCKQLLGLHRIRVPGFVRLAPGRRTPIPRTLRFPVVVKPVFTDGSEGISNASLVTDAASLLERARFVHERWKQAAIAEEYIEGRELYVSVIGNRRLVVLPPRELFFKAPDGNGPVLATYRVKWDEQYQERWRIKFGNARLDGADLARIARVCRKACRVLQVRDFGRVDLRLTPDGHIVVLEVNPNPDLAYGDEVAEAAERAGIRYDALVARVLRHAMRRYT
jgi:D-alanine-D-alanine ligase